VDGAGLRRMGPGAKLEPWLAGQSMIAYTWGTMEGATRRRRSHRAPADAVSAFLGLADRSADLQRIRNSLGHSLLHSTPRALVARGDSLPLLRSFPDRSVSLVLTDPPYHATKKSNIYGDTHFGGDEHYLSWIETYAVEWRRILRPNGSLSIFCDSSMAARIEVLLGRLFNVLSRVVWTKPNDPGFDGWKGKMRKEALRQWYPHSERMLFAEPALDGNLFRSPLGQFLRQMRLRAGMTMKELAEVIGAYGRVNHGGAVSNWEEGRNTPSRDQYEKISGALLKTGRIAEMPPYDDVVRPFSMDRSKEFTDVWTFASVRPYPGKHPAEKPLALLEHVIAAVTSQGDIVLDCFGGGGNTGIAALRLRRRTVLIEIEAKWADQIASRVNAFTRAEELFAPEMPRDSPTPPKDAERPIQMGLFGSDR